MPSVCLKVLICASLSNIICRLRELYVGKTMQHETYLFRHGVDI